MASRCAAGGKSALRSQLSKSFSLEHLREGEESQRPRKTMWWSLKRGSRSENLEEARKGLLQMNWKNLLALSSELCS